MKNIHRQNTLRYLNLSFNVAGLSDNMLYYLIDQIYIWFALGITLGLLMKAPLPKRPIAQRVQPPR